MGQQAQGGTQTAAAKGSAAKGGAKGAGKTAGGKPAFDTKALPAKPLMGGKDNQAKARRVPLAEFCQWLCDGSLGM